MPCTGLDGTSSESPGALPCTMSCSEPLGHLGAELQFLAQSQISEVPGCPKDTFTLFYYYFSVFPRCQSSLLLRAPVDSVPSSLKTLSQLPCLVILISWPLLPIRPRSRRWPAASAPVSALRVTVTSASSWFPRHHLTHTDENKHHFHLTWEEKGT